MACRGNTLILRIGRLLSLWQFRLRYTIRSPSRLIVHSTQLKSYPRCVTGITGCLKTKRIKISSVHAAFALFIAYFTLFSIFTIREGGGSHTFTFNEQGLTQGSEFSDVLTRHQWDRSGGQLYVGFVYFLELV